MSSRLQSASASTSPSFSSHSTVHRAGSLTSDHYESTRTTSKAWVDPASLPDYGDVSSITGNAPDYVKQLNHNTFFSYGVGDEDCFGHKVGSSVKFVDVSIDKRQERHGRLEATTVAEIIVSKCVSHRSIRFIVVTDVLWNHRHAQWRWYATWWMRSIPDRQVCPFIIMCRPSSDYFFPTAAVARHS